MDVPGAHFSTTVALVKYAPVALAKFQLVELVSEKPTAVSELHEVAANSPLPLSGSRQIWQSCASELV